MYQIKTLFIYFTYFIVAMSLTNCKTVSRNPRILLFNGTGSSPTDVDAIQNILSSNQMGFELVNSDQVNALDTSELRKYKLLIIPGGNFITMGKSLTIQTTTNVQTAVRQGLNYFGICAGGFLAGDTRNNGFNITNGTQFRFYSAEDKGIRKAIVTVTNADGPTIEHYWEDGPQFSGWGDVVSKYPDGTPATVQGKYGSGFVVLTGVHAEAPESWRKEFHFSTSIENSHRYATKLIKAALEQREMPHF